MVLSPQEKINIFKNFFKARGDVFAKRWQKADKSSSGYSPVCLNEWNKSLCYKVQGKRCTNCPNSNYVGMGDKYIEQHLNCLTVFDISDNLILAIKRNSI